MVKGPGRGALGGVHMLLSHILPKYLQDPVTQSRCAPLRSSSWAVEMHHVAELR